MENFENWLIILTIVCFVHIVITVIYFVMHHPEKKNHLKKHVTVMKNMMSDEHNHESVDVVSMKYHELITMLNDSTVDEIKMARQIFQHGKMAQRVEMCDRILKRKINQQ